MAILLVEIHNSSIYELYLFLIRKTQLYYFKPTVYHNNCGLTVGITWAKP